MKKTLSTFFLYFTAALFIAMNPLLGDTISKPLPGAHLQAKIKIGLVIPNQNVNEPMLPGNLIKLNALVRNMGEMPNYPGVVFVRFSFQKPLNHSHRSINFETEKQKLPIISPGKEIEIDFSKTQELPSILEYIRNEWNLREYEVVVIINKKEQVIGRAAISLSAHYQPGESTEIPAEVDGAK